MNTLIQRFGSRTRRYVNLTVGAVTLALVGMVLTTPNAHAVPATKCEWVSPVKTPIANIAGNAIGLGQFIGGILLILGVVALIIISFTKWFGEYGKKVGVLALILIGLAILLNLVDLFDGPC